MRRKIWAAGIWLATAVRLLAHDPGLSTAQVDVQTRTIIVSVTFSTADLAALHPPDPAGPDWIRTLFRLRTGEREMAAGGVSVRTAPTPGEFQFQLLYSGTSPGTAYELTARRLADLPPGHRQYIAITDPRGQPLTEKLLTAADSTVTFTTPAYVPPPLRPDTAPAAPTRAPPDAGRPQALLDPARNWGLCGAILGLLLGCRTPRTLGKHLALTGLAAAAGAAVAVGAGLAPSGHAADLAGALALLFLAWKMVRFGREPRPVDLVSAGAVGFVLGFQLAWHRAAASNEAAARLAGGARFWSSLQAMLLQAAIAVLLILFLRRWRDRPGMARPVTLWVAGGLVVLGIAGAVGIASGA